MILGFSFVKLSKKKRIREILQFVFVSCNYWLLRTLLVTDPKCSMKQIMLIQYEWIECRKYDDAVNDWLLILVIDLHH